FEILANNVYFTESRSSSASATYETRSDEYADSEDNFNLSFSSGDADDFTVIDDDEDLPF
ncbi:MAG: single-stranded DNA-binding protein, partial [Ruminococcaceae bacterium]|nr:single-stranded DNA-binding protein [Oscillospiraceae bacterium]